MKKSTIRNIVIGLASFVGIGLAFYKINKDKNQKRIEKISNNGIDNSKHYYTIGVKDLSDPNSKVKSIGEIDN